MKIQNQNNFGNQQQTLITGYLLVIFGIFISFFFGYGVEGDAVFKLSRPRDEFVIPNLIVPASKYNFLISFILVFIGARLILKRMSSFSSLYLGLGLFLLITCFLVWATAGKSFSLTGMMQATIIRATPIALAALAGVLSERVAIINIGIEGMLLVGAFSGAVFGSLFGGVARHRRVPQEHAFTAELGMQKQIKEIYTPCNPCGSAANQASPHAADLRKIGFSF